MQKTKAIVLQMHISNRTSLQTHSLIAKLKALAQTLWIMEPDTSKFSFFCKEWNSGEPHQLEHYFDTFNFGAIYILIESTQGQYLRYWKFKLA